MILNIYDTYNCDHTTFRFYLIDFQLHTYDSPSQFYVFFFYLKITLRYSKIGFARKSFKKRAKSRRLFFAKLQAQIILLAVTLIENNFRFLDS